jgi:lipopolysaccharide/colanic/teichoic acid biosynthesis glycosyltransferase
MKTKGKNNFLISLFLILGLSISFLLDKYTFDLVNSIKNNYFDIFFKYITYLGEFFIVLTILTILFLLKKKEERNIPLLWIGFFILGGIVVVLKFLVSRVRPFDLISFYSFTELVDYSFPSLHAAIAIFALIIMIKEMPKQSLVWIIISLLIFFSRIYLKVHYLSDVVGGIILGLIAANFYLKNTNLKTYHVIKRILDFIISSITLIVLSPIFLIVSFFILIITGRPIIFKQERMGKDGDIFTIYKFRSMVVGAEDLQNQGISKQKLITSVGKIIRPLYLDETLQFWNILMGDMALIGPRPWAVLDFFSLGRSDKKNLGFVKIRPGLTGLERIMNYLDEEDKKEIEKELKISKLRKYFSGDILLLNFYYIKNESFLLDIKIIYWTIKSLFEHLFKLRKK